jgi:hypothetical protein
MRSGSSKAEGSWAWPRSWLGGMPNSSQKARVNAS